MKATRVSSDTTGVTDETKASGAIVTTGAAGTCSMTADIGAVFAPQQHGASAARFSGGEAMSQHSPCPPLTAPLFKHVTSALAGMKNNATQRTTATNLNVRYIQ